jgi:hypothetical protein
MNPKISEQQKSKPAYIYVRQSTLAQVRHHQESTERQYALQQKAMQLGWSGTSTRILDRDLGISGAHTTSRTDFKTLVADVSMGQVGAVFAFEASRLARSNADWHRLLELCALTRTPRDRRGWLLRSGGLQRWFIAGTQGNNGTSGVALYPRAPPGR